MVIGFIAGGAECVLARTLIAGAVTAVAHTLLTSRKPFSDDAATVVVLTAAACPACGLDPAEWSSSIK